MPDIFDQVEQKTAPAGGRPAPPARSTDSKRDMFDDAEETLTSLAASYASPASYGEVGKVLKEHLPDIGAVAATAFAGPGTGMLARAGLAALGGAGGSAGKSLLSGNRDPISISGTAVGEGAFQGAAQLGGEAFFNGLGAIAKGVAGKTVGKARPIRVTPASDLPEFTPWSPTPAYEDFQTKSLGHLAAQEELEGANLAVQRTHQAATEALDAMSQANVQQAGQSAQKGFKLGSDIWHRHGNELYDIAAEKLAGVDIPTHDVSFEAGRLIDDRVAALRAGKPEGEGAAKNVFDFTPGTKAILEELRRLPETVPFQTLDIIRKKLLSVGPEAGELAANEAQGIAKHLTRFITESMERGAAAPGVDPAAAAAAKAARTYWKEGAQAFDNAIMTRAMRINPEDVVNMVHPGTGRVSPGISEAQRIREGLLGFVEKYGSPTEIEGAKQTYKDFLTAFTRRNLLGTAPEELATLGKRMKSYGPEVMDELYGALPEGKVILTNLKELSAGVDAASARAGAALDAQKLSEAARKSYLASVKQAGAETAETAARAEKVAQAKRESVEKIIKTRQEKIRNAIHYSILSATVGSELRSPGITGLAVGAIAYSAADALMPYVLKSTLATKYITKGLTEAVAATTKVPGPILPANALAEYVTPAWMTNLVRGFRIANDLMADDQTNHQAKARQATPASPIPTLGPTSR